MRKPDGRIKSRVAGSPARTPVSFPIISATHLLLENLFFLTSWRSDGQAGSLPVRPSDCYRQNAHLVSALFPDEMPTSNRAVEAG